MSDIITVDNLNLWYGETKALKDINIHIKEQHNRPYRSFGLRKIDIFKDP